MKIETLIIYGVGLLGGSIGLAAKEKQIATRVIGVGRNEKRLQKALDLGTIDEYTTDVENLRGKAGIAVVCIPVGLIPKIVEQLTSILSPDSILTDVGSTKAQMIQAIIDKVGPTSRPAFVGSHPMAGSEKTGVAYSRVDLYEGSTCILTPTADTPADAIKTIEAFWKNLGAHVLQLNPEQHDLCVAAASHVPHLTATALCHYLKAVAEKTPEILDITSTGFRDTTRVAGGDPVMWRDICLDNSEAICEGLDALIAHLQNFRNVVQKQDADTIQEILAKGQAVRLSLDPEND